ncbi:hypothetical protein CQA62_05405 [Helicobacter cholecystus]|uniref:Autotransporter domain-containing protein n=1 Tax=Helicobacter cholecystus TaxID=45498 RepID=A0A3D8IW19_9HELI|nr:autotransporter outer membrane beta-barrel domain-containing protein [Helicobacter cholecystus]RDU68824.1 hypothetical protein CQA62_05405 [Helicobacter cholecystus]VEJ23898.1 toxin-like outer membrane protein [Helicobacter cholecystus]
MRKSYIALSLVLSQALCADTDLIADFGNNSTSLNVTKPKNSQVQRDQSQQDLDQKAVYGVDWSGGTSYLNLKTNDLTFSFKDDSRTAQNLVLSDGLTIRNNVASSGESKTQAKITIAKDGSSLKTLLIGQNSAPNNKITIGSDINLLLESFSDVKVISNLYLGIGSVFDVSNIDTFSNNGGIVLEGSDSTLKVKDTLTNNGVIMMKEGSKITSISNLSITANSQDQKNGSILIQGSAEINSGVKNLTITNQDITLQNLVSKQDGKITTTPSILALKSTNNSGTLTLGDSNKEVSITGEIGNQDPSNISNSEIPQGSEIGKLVIEGFSAIDLKNANFKNITLESTSVSSLDLNMGKLSLENTSIKLSSTSTLKNSDTSNPSTITLKSHNSISVGDEGTLSITGNHSFSGEGTLDFVGKVINLGDSLNLSTTGLQGSVKIGVSAKEKIATNNFTLTDLTLQAIESQITNTSITLSNATLQGINHNAELSELNITKNGSNGSIKVLNGQTATLEGSGIVLNGQDMSLENSGSGKTTLILKAGSGGITFNGGENGSKIEGKSSDMSKNLLFLQSSSLITQGKVTLENIVVMSDRDVSIIGTEAKDTNGSKGLFITQGSNSNASTLFIGNQANGETRFYTLTLASQGLEENQQAYVKIDAGSANPSAVDFRASSFIFQNQEIDLATSASGTKLRLFAYGDGLIDAKFLEMKQGNPSAQLSSSGAFNFSNTTFSDGSSSKVELYAGNGGVHLLPINLTLKNVSLDAKIIDDNGGNNFNTLNLSTKGSINILGTSTIEASKFVYGDEQGIGVDLLIGNESTKGSLVLKATSGSEENFAIGGEIALDLRGNGGASNVDIEITNGTAKKLSDNTLGLTFKGGGLSIIGSNGNHSSTYTFKAKTFKFEELKEGDHTLIASPFIKVQNAQLTLNGDSSMSEIDVIGTTYLLGDSAGSSETKLLATNNGNTSGAQVTLKLHDIEATGKASIAENKLSFENSNIKVSNSDNSQGLLLVDKTTSSNGNAISGTINSITLESGKLQIKQDSSQAEITLRADALLTSSGISSLSIKSIKVAESGLYSLKVNDGVFTLTEESAGSGLGAITLGSEETPLNGAGGIFEYKKNGGYNSLTFKDHLTSYGNSSIIADTFTLNAKEDQSNYALSSTGGMLTFQAQQSTDPLEITTDLTLKNGGFKYVDKEGQNAELRFGAKSSITSSGESVIEAKNLDINGVNLTSTQGTLSLKGINSSTKVGKVSVGDAGVLRAQGGNSRLATLRVNDSIALSASVPYITPSEPLGKGVFGQVVAESILFESQDTSSLITLSLTQASQTSTMSDSLFALREGGIILIDTNSGIKKKISSAEYGNITLEDVKSSLGAFSSISLTPYFKYGTDLQGKEIVEDLMLNLKVTQNDVTQLLESIKDPNKKAQMQSLLSSGNNALVIQSIMNSKDNPLKTGMALYISNGNVEIVANTLEYVTGAFIGLNDSLYASHKIANGLNMVKAINVENRMVRAKNPYLAKLEVAKLLKRAIGVAYASNDDEILLEEESGIKEGELWVSFDGAMGFSKTLGNVSVYGFSGGYDTLLGEQKNYLLGFYFGYGYGAYSANFTTNNSHNVSLGFYSRMSFENNEVDLIASQSIGLNTASIDYGATNSYVAQMLKQSINYNFYTTNIEARYGYVFNVGEKESPYYFRPFGGINFAMVINSEGRGDGEAAIGINSLTTYQLGVNMGVEMRKYFGENYIFLLPMLEKGLLNDGSGTKIGFVGSASIGYNLPYTVDTAMSVYLGGQGNVGENIAISGGAGVKVGLQSKEVSTNWNVGIRYKF